MSDLSSQVQQAMGPAISAERWLRDRRLSTIRAAAVTLFLLLTVVLSHWVGAREWQADLASFSIYWIVSLLLFAAAQRPQGWRRLGGLAICLIDMPAVFWLQCSSLEASPSPSGVAGFTLALFSLLVILITWSLDSWQVVLGCVVAALLEVRLQQLARVGWGAQIAAVTVMALTGAACLYNQSRARSLLRDVMTGLVRDRNERRKVEERLRIGDRMASTAALAAGVAHEINNPVAYVLSNLEFISEELDRLRIGGRDGQIQIALQETLDGASRIRDVVKDLQTISRDETEEMEGVELRRVIEPAIGFIRKELPPNTTLVVELPSGPPVRGHRARLSQLFLNLLLNAVQALPPDREGNRISVRTGVEPLEGLVWAEISDNGPDLAPEAVDRLFDPTYSPHVLGIGTGLGLSLCKSIVASHGGTLIPKIVPGEGTRLRVTLPIYVSPRSVAPAGAAPRILLMSEEPLIRTAFARVLGTTGEVHLATDSMEVLERLRQGERFELVIADLSTRESPGAILYKGLRAMGAPTTPLVFLVGSRRSLEVEKLLEGSDVERLSKPFHSETLRQLLERRLNTSLPRRDLRQAL